MNNFFYGPEMETYDAIVVGSGISGGWAAKELTEKGLRTLVLERGRMVKHVEDYITAHMDPWDFPHRGRPTKEILEKQPKQSRTGYTIEQATHMWFVNDLEHPYNETKRFDWMRGYHLGGRSLQWGRQTYRWNKMDFEANAREGIAIDWPVRYKDIAPWYTKVEQFIGVSGEALGLPQLPDGEFLPPMELNCVEKDFKQSVMEQLGRTVTIGRVAHLTGSKNFDGRSKCQYRDRCIRGCPFGAYFSSLSSTLPAAEATGNLTVRPDAIVHQIMYDQDTKRATGVKVIDALTKESHEFKAKVIFLCASTIATPSILMQSRSDRFPNGMGNDSDQLGRNIMDHHLGVGAYGKVDGHEDQFYRGRRPNGIYIPRFRNLGGESDRADYKRGFGYQGGASRNNWDEVIAEVSHGKALKEAILRPGGWTMGIMGFGEVLPYQENRFTLDYDRLDSWGLPTVTFDAELRDNERNMRKDMMDSAVDMLEKAGVRDINAYNSETALGAGIHEMGTARMGRDPKTSVVNAFNALHDVPNVYLTDGSFMTSASCVNPSLTYMAFTARAVDHAVKQLKNGNL